MSKRKRKPLHGAAPTRAAEKLSLSREAQIEAFRRKLAATDYEGVPRWAMYQDEIILELLEAGLIEYDPKRDAVRWIGTDEDLARILGREAAK